MRTETRTVSVGEYLGPVDWDNLDKCRMPALTEEQRGWLRDLEANTDAYQATTDGGWPRFCWHPVLNVGMYDGWPYWSPGPAVQTLGPLGPEWHWAYSLTGCVRKARPDVPVRGGR